MKGIVFTEFLDMVESKFGYETVDYIIENSNLASKGIYTSIGTYDHSEIVQLITQLHHRTGIAVPDLLNAYGKYLHGTFTKNYQQFFEEEKNTLDFLETIDSHIHIEVNKIYPDAQLPSFETQRLNGNTLEMIYKSDRRMADFALGLIEATMEYYGEQGKIETEAIQNDGSVVRFVITIES